MSEIALYNLLRKIPDATDDEAKEAIADIASSNQAEIGDLGDIH